MTADLDLSPEAVERLTKMAETLESSAVNAERMCELLQPEFDAFEARTGHNSYVVRDYLDHRDAAERQRKEASAIRALAAENARLRAERDAAWQSGAEAMREAAINAAGATQPPIPRQHPLSLGADWQDGFETCRNYADSAIRALPLPGRPKEDEA